MAATRENVGRQKWKWYISREKRTATLTFWQRNRSKYFPRVRRETKPTRRIADISGSDRASFGHAYYQSRAGIPRALSDARILRRWKRRRARGSIKTRREGRKKEKYLPRQEDGVEGGEIVGEMVQLRICQRSRWDRATRFEAKPRGWVEAELTLELRGWEQSFENFSKVCSFFRRICDRRTILCCESRVEKFEILTLCTFATLCQSPWNF